MDLKPRAATFGRVTADIWGVLWSSPPWFVAHIVTVAALSALEPGTAWVAKDAVGALEKAQGTLEGIALPNAGLYLAIALGLSLLRLVEHMSNKVYESTVVFALQRVMLRRRPTVRPGEDVTRMVYDCIEAKKSLSPLYTNLWRDLCKLVAVALWQLTIAPAWLPALLLSLLLPVLGILWLAPHVQKAKRRVLEDNCRVTAHAPEGCTASLVHSQHRLLGRFVALEAWTGGMEALIRLSAWPMLLALVLICHALELPLIPERLAMGDLAAVLVGLALIQKPVVELGKSYVTLRGNWPALMRALYPHLPEGGCPPCE
jgi:hypothetical protein